MSGTYVKNVNIYIYKQLTQRISIPSCNYFKNETQWRTFQWIFAEKEKQHMLEEKIVLI